MGKFGKIVNAYACIWTFFVSIIFIMPTERPVAASTMNYAVAFLGGILLFAAVYWYAGGRKFYTGPLIEAELVEEQTSSGDASDADVKREKE